MPRRVQRNSHWTVVLQRLPQTVPRLLPDHDDAHVDGAPVRGYHSERRVLTVDDDEALCACLLGVQRCELEPRPSGGRSKTIYGTSLQRQGGLPL